MSHPVRDRLFVIRWGEGGGGALVGFEWGSCQKIGTQATGYSSRRYFPRIAGYIRGTTRIPTRADNVSVVCG